MIQFLKRISPITSASFSPVDSNQLVCAERDGVYIVDIRKPKRSVFFSLIPHALRVYVTFELAYYSY